VAQLHDRYMMMMIIYLSVCVCFISRAIVESDTTMNYRLGLKMGTVSPL